jgi:hypothetical protein
VLLCAAGAAVGLGSRWLELPNVPGDVLLDLRGEGNLPAYYSTALLLVAGLLLLLMAQADGSAAPQRRGTWRALGFMFLYLSADECAQLHEVARKVPRSWLPDMALFHWPWVVLGGLAVVVVTLASYRFLRDLPTDTRRNLIVAGAVFATGALCLELLGAAIEHHGWSEAYLVVEETAEELLEMLGVVLLIRALLTHLERHVPVVSVQFAPGRDAES